MSVGWGNCFWGGGRGIHRGVTKALKFLGGEVSGGVEVVVEGEVFPAPGAAGLDVEQFAVDVVIVFDLVFDGVAVEEGDDGGDGGAEGDVFDGGDHGLATGVAVGGVGATGEEEGGGERGEREALHGVPTSVQENG